MAASAPRTSSQNPTTTIALISPSHALGSPSFSASQMFHSPIAFKRQFLNTSSHATMASTSSSPALGRIGSSLNTSASPTSSEFPSYATECCVATYGPSPSNKHIAKLARILCPSLAFPSAVGFLVMLYYQPELAKWFERVANENGGQQAKDLWRSFQNARDLDKMRKMAKIESDYYRKLDLWLERRLILHQAQDGTPLTPEQVKQVHEEEEAMQREEQSIWRGDVRLIPASCNKLLVDQF